MDRWINDSWMGRWVDGHVSGREQDGRREEENTELEMGIVTCILPNCMYDSTFSVLFYL